MYYNFEVNLIPNIFRASFASVTTLLPSKLAISTVIKCGDISCAEPYKLTLSITSIVLRSLFKSRFGVILNL